MDDHPQVKILGEAENVRAGRELLERTAPDIIFLDIHIGKEKGFQVLEGVTAPPHVVLTTSHPQYALQGFDVDALDYILKPVTGENLARALERFSRRGQMKEEKGEAGIEPLGMESTLFLKLRDEFRAHQVSELVLITTDRPYTNLHVVGGGRFLHRRSLREWKEVLPERAFLALDRSTMVNVQAIGKLVPDGDKHMLHFSCEGVAPVRVGPGAVRVLRECLEG